MVNAINSSTQTKTLERASNRVRSDANINTKNKNEHDKKEGVPCYLDRMKTNPILREVPECPGQPLLKGQKTLPKDPKKLLSTLASKFSNKASGGKKKAEGSKATFFHIEGQSWDSKGFAILDNPEVERMRNARPQTTEERLQEQFMQEEEVRIMTEEAERWRKYFANIDDARKEREAEGQQLDEFTQEDNAKKAKLLEKALLAKHEQDQIVKRATRAIQEAKCHAMWSAQIKERKILEKAAMDYEVVKNIEIDKFNKQKMSTQEEEDEQKRLQREKFASEVRKQMEDRVNMRFIQEERLQEEARMQRQALEQTKREMEIEAVQKRIRKEKYRRDLNLSMEITADFKRMISEQERQDEARICHYNRDKQMRELEKRAEQESLKKEKQRKQDTLYTKQMKMMDAARNREEMRYLAERERLDRKVRKLEKEAVEKQARVVAEMRENHRKQMANIRELRSCYFAEQERDYQKFAAEVKAIKKKDAEEAEKLIVKKRDLRVAVAAQINDKEMKRRYDVEMERMEAEKAREAEYQRKADIQKVIQLKLDTVRQAECMPTEQLRSLETRVKSLHIRRLGDARP